MLDSKTVTWNSVTIFYDSTVMANEDTLETMIMELQKKISVVMFDISIKPIKEILNMHDRIGKNFFVIGKQLMAKNVFELVRLSNRFFKIINWNVDFFNDDSRNRMPGRHALLELTADTGTFFSKLAGRGYLRSYGFFQRRCAALP